MAEPLEKLLGYCPLGCGNTLYRLPEGFIWCLFSECPNPNAAAAILADAEIEHIVDLYHSSFTIRHPLRERINDALLTCDLHQLISELYEPPRKPGRYRVFKENSAWAWQTLFLR